MERSGVKDLNALQWKRGISPWREVWFYKINQPQTDPTRFSAFWLRYEILIPKPEVKIDPFCEVWGIAFRKEGIPVALKQRMPLEQHTLSSDGRIFFGSSFLSSNSCEGSLSVGGQSFTWKLSYPPFPHPIVLIPEWMNRYWLAKMRLCTPQFDIAVSGEIIVNGESYRLTHAPAMQGHYWARQISREWAWAHGSLWSYTTQEGRSSSAQKLVWEGLSGRINLGPIMLPPLTAMIALWNGREIPFNDFSSLLRTKSRYRLGLWEFASQSFEWQLEGKLTAEKEQIVGVQYTDTDGSPVYCYNSMIASGELILRQKRRPGHWMEVLTASAEHSAGMEWGTREKVGEVSVIL
ncbi:MAG: hypothetical protein HY391_02955 [Deltaproteobacteria bacterium]|nr:hypothetical protein [Deltaproteobacteria bacterium]